VVLVVPPPLVPVVVPVVPPRMPVLPLLVTVPAPPPGPMVFVVTPCCSSIGVREHASAVNDNARPIASQRHSQIMATRLSAKYSEGCIVASRRSDERPDHGLQRAELQDNLSKKLRSMSFPRVSLMMGRLGEIKLATVLSTFPRPDGKNIDILDSVGHDQQPCIFLDDPISPSPSSCSCLPGLLSYGGQDPKGLNLVHGRRDYGVPAISDRRLILYKARSESAEG